MRRRESTVASTKDGDVQVRVPAYSKPCSYVRIVRRGPRGRLVELCYWDSTEWQDDPRFVCIGAIMGSIKAVLELRSDQIIVGNEQGGRVHA